LDVECNDWREAVRRSGKKLLELGYIEERYIEAMICNIEENGPYVVLSKGFAVPHEGLEQGSVKVGMSLIRLKTPVPFGEEELDPVEFVCCLSAVDHKTHLKAFFNLVNMLQNEEFKKKLHECKYPEEAAAIVEKYEYSVV
jgi:mannitol/fructose-specific phosphotransferase system IIA component (Ntr-type)